MGRLILSNGVIHSDEDFELRSGTDANLRTRFRICSRNDQHTKIKSLSAHDVSIENSLCVKGDLTVLGTCTVQYCTLTSCTSAVQNNFVVTSTDDSSTAAPDLKLYRESASPANNDTLGHIQFSGKDSAGNETEYAGIRSCIRSVTSGSECGVIINSVNMNGTSCDIFRVENTGAWVLNNRQLYLTGTGSLRNYGANLNLTTGGGSYDVVIKPNDAEAGRIGADCTSKFGAAELGSWPANADYTYFGHKALDHSSDDHYALLQQCTGRTFINSNTCVSFRICNSDKLRYTNTKFCSLLPSIFTSCVGIGTTDPGTKLHTHTSGNNSIYITSSNNTSGASKTALWLGHNHPTSGDWAGIIFDADDKLRITNSSSSTGNDIVIDSSNRVGLSTASPTAKLDVRGTGTDGDEVFRIESDGNVNDGGYHWMTSEIASGQTTDANIIHLIGRAQNSKNSGYFGFNYQADGSDSNFITLGGYAANHLLNITMGGNVGIGTTTPAFSSGGSGIEIERTTATLRLQHPGSHASEIYQNTSALSIADLSSGTMRFLVSNSECARLNATGLGIKTTNPSTALHVAGQGTFANNGCNIILKNTWSSGNQDILFGGGSVSTGGANNTAARIRSLATAPGGAATGDLLFTVNCGDTFIDALYIQEDGKVGVGTTSPNKTLEVEYVSSSTNVTCEGLHGGGAGQGLLIYNNNQSTDYVYANLDFRARNADGRIAYQYQAATNVGDFHFITDNTGAPQTMMVIKNDGNVGIGTTNPARKFDVRSGDINIDAGKRYLWSSGDAAILSCGYNMMFETYTGSALTEKVRIQGNGYVGIGTTCAYSPLQVYSSADQKILLSGSTNPYIRWQCGSSNRAYIQWIESGSIFGFFNSAGDNFDFFTHDSGAINLRLKGNDGDIWGSVYATDNSGTHQVGILDGDQHWAAKHVNDTCWEFLTNNQSRMFINSTGVYSASRLGFCYPSNCGPYFEAGGTYSAPSVFLKRHDGSTTVTCLGAGVLCASTCVFSPFLRASCSSLECACLVVGTGGFVPVIKAGGGNTDLRICSAGTGGWIDFHANGSMRLCISTAGAVCAPGCFVSPVFCSTYCVDTPQVNLTSDGLITFYGNGSSNHAIMNRDTGGNVADDIRINSYGAVHVNLDSNNNNTANAGFNVYRHGGGTGNLSDLLFAVDGEGSTTCVFGDLCVTGSVIADGMVGDCLASQAVCTGTICFNTSCVTGYDAVYDVYVSSNPNCGGSTQYRDIVHMTVYVTTGWNGSAVTKYINHVNNFVRGAVHDSGGGSVTAVPKLLVGTTGCECYAAACATCLQIQVAGGSYKYDTCVKIKQVL